jgi:hypothetical protein
MGKEVALRDWKNPTTAIVVAVIVITVLFIPMVPTRESYNQTEEYGREARYEVASVTFEEESELPGVGTYHVSRVVVKNIDPYGGTFWVTHFLYDANGLHETRMTGEYLSEGENKTFRAEFDTQGLQDAIGGYSVSPPTVIDRRVVTKYRTVYKSVIELLIYH